MSRTPRPLALMRQLPIRLLATFDPPEGAVERHRLNRKAGQRFGRKQRQQPS
jgi:hypothetical protein